MFQLREPSDYEIHSLLGSLEDAQPSYHGAGATRHGKPLPGYFVDRYSECLGMGYGVFERAKKALREWRMFDLGWMRLLPEYVPVEVGVVVAAVARHYGFWSVNPARVLYVVEDERRFCFAYGTLHGHGARGEERFCAELREDGYVWYDVLAYSRPAHQLSWAGLPLVRSLQRRFAGDSRRTIAEVVNGDRL